MILERHPTVAHQFMVELEGHPDMPNLHAAAASVRSLTGVTELAPPSWQALAAGARSKHGNRTITSREVRAQDGNMRRFGWRSSAEKIFSRVGEDLKALVQSQGGQGVGLVLSACPTCRVTMLEPPSDPHCSPMFVSVCLCLSLFVPAGVACHSTLVATTMQRARMQGSSAGGGGRCRL